MQLPIGVDQKAAQSLQLQLFEQVRRLILDGRLKPGTLMPASRVLASDLNLSRNTVVLAYERLMSEGYLEVRQPAGTFVSSSVIFDAPSQPALANEDQDTSMNQGKRLVFHGASHVVVPPYNEPVLYDFWVGRPDARLFPTKTWQRLFNCKLRQMQTGMSSYGEPAGLGSLRQAVIDYVGAARGIKADASQVLIVNGIQEALNVLARLFIQSGTDVAVENPCYRGAANVFASHGARLVPIPVDDNGVDVAHLPHNVAFTYLTPSHQYPTGGTLSLERRKHLLGWAEQEHSYLVEDDYDSDFYYDGAPLPAMKSLGEDDHVIYLGTFSKSLAPGLRLGYMIVPAHLVEPATTVKALLNNCSPWLPQALLAEFVASGAFMHHLRRIRTTYRARRDCLLSALHDHFGDVHCRGTQAGMHCVWQLPEDFPLASSDLEHRCRGEGVGIYSVKTGNAIVMDDAEVRYAHHVMLGYAALNKDEIGEGIRRMAQAL